LWRALSAGIPGNNVSGYIYPGKNKGKKWRESARITISVARREFASAFRAFTRSTESAIAKGVSSVSFRLT
jgi:hypothetical protein